MNIQKAMENGPVEIVDFPMNSMVDLSMAKCGCSPEGIHSIFYESNVGRYKIYTYTDTLNIIL